MKQSFKALDGMRREGRSCQDNSCSPMTTPAGGKKIGIIAHIASAAESTADAVKTWNSRSLRKIPFPTRHRKLWYPGAMGSVELQTSNVPYTNSNMCPAQAGNRHHQTPSNLVDGFVHLPWISWGTGLPCSHLGPNQVLGLPGWQWLHCPHFSAFYPQRFGRGEQARAAAGA